METLTFALTLAAELIPLFVLISTAVYLVVEKLTRQRIRAILGGSSRWVGVPIAAGIGALTPFCSCSTVPLVNGMKSAGIPTASMIAFLIASPLVNPVAVALLGSTVGIWYAVAYAGVGVIFAMTAGLVVDRWHGPLVGTAELEGRAAPTVSAYASESCSPGGTNPLGCTGTSAIGGGGLAVLEAPPATDCCGTAGASRAASLVESVPEAFGKALADLRKLWLPLVLAIGVGAVIHGYVPAELLASIAGPDQPWAIPAAALLGVPVYASIIVLLPLGATLLGKGVGLGAVTAFLMGASGFSLPEGILLARILPRGLLVKVLAVFSVGVIAIGYGFQWLVG